eukprot:8236002-Pyramimonas_sp.AAC.1
MRPHVTPDGWDEASASASDGGEGASKSEKGNEAPIGYEYELAAILLHKGASACSGHYVTHVKHEFTGQWWLFDDERVTLLGDDPFGKAGSGGSSANGEVVVISDDGDAKTVKDQRAGEPMFSSCNAYLLIYRQRKQQSHCNGEESSASQDVPIPPKLAEAVEKKIIDTQKAVELYQNQRDTIHMLMQERQEEVRKLMAVMPVEEGPEAPFYWCNADFIRDWADNSDPPQSIDNRAI